MKRIFAVAVLVTLAIFPLALLAEDVQAKPKADVVASTAPVHRQMRVIVTQDQAQSADPIMFDDDDALLANPGQVIIAQNQPKHVQTGTSQKIEKNVVFYRRIGAGPRWWKNSDMVQKIGVSDAQVQQMENIFQENRIKLIDLKAGLEKQEARLEPLMQADNPDEGQIAGQIDKVAAARAELEKANALMLVSIRRVLTLDQWKKLQTLQPQSAGPVRFSIPLPPPGPNAPLPPE